MLRNIWTVLTTGNVNAQGDRLTNSESLKELQYEGAMSKSITEKQWQQIKKQMGRENRSRKKKFHLKKGTFSSQIT